MFQFFLSSTGGLSGHVSMAMGVSDAALVVDRPMSASVSLVMATTANLKNIAALSASVAFVLATNSPELVLPLGDTGEDDLRRRAKRGDVWEFRGRKIEQLR